jgi:hypothetical protein
MCIWYLQIDCEANINIFKYKNYYNQDDNDNNSNNDEEGRMRKQPTFKCFNNCRVCHGVSTLFVSSVRDK